MHIVLHLIFSLTLLNPNCINELTQWNKGFADANSHTSSGWGADLPAGHAADQVLGGLWETGAWG